METGDWKGAKFRQERQDGKDPSNAYASWVGDMAKHAKRREERANAYKFINQAPKNVREMIFSPTGLIKKNPKEWKKSLPNERQERDTMGQQRGWVYPSDFPHLGEGYAIDAAVPSGQRPFNHHPNHLLWSSRSGHGGDHLEGTGHIYHGDGTRTEIPGVHMWPPPGHTWHNFPTAYQTHQPPPPPQPQQWVPSVWPQNPAHQWPRLPQNEKK